jgi:hypothetical protein
LAGIGFMALAGLGLGLILENFDGYPKWRRVGWLLLTVGAVVGGLCLLLGLP